MPSTHRHWPTEKGPSLAATNTRTPLWRMTDEQLRAYVEDNLVSWDKRKTAETILVNREQQRRNAAAFLQPKTTRRTA